MWSVVSLLVWSGHSNKWWESIILSLNQSVQIRELKDSKSQFTMLNVKPGAGISLFFIEKHKGASRLNAHPTGEWLSTIQMPSQHVHWGGYLGVSPSAFGTEANDWGSAAFIPPVPGKYLEVLSCRRSNLRPLRARRWFCLCEVKITVIPNNWCSGNKLYKVMSAIFQIATWFQTHRGKCQKQLGYWELEVWSEEYDLSLIRYIYWIHIM